MKYLSFRNLPKNLKKVCWTNYTDSHMLSRQFTYDLVSVLSERNTHDKQLHSNGKMERLNAHRHCIRMRFRDKKLIFTQ